MKKLVLAALAAYATYKLFQALKPKPEPKESQCCGNCR